MTEDFKELCLIVSAVCYLVTFAGILSWNGHYSEAIGVGGAVTALFALAKGRASDKG